MTHSVLKSLFDRFRHLVDQVSKKPVQILGRAEIKTMAGRDLNDGLVVGVHNRLAEADINNAIVVSKLGEHIDIGHGYASVSYLPPVLSDSQLSTASYNNFIVRHQIHPIGTSCNIVNVHPGAAGVES